MTEEISSIMQGKVCLVTGGTSGIGMVTATSLAAVGAEVIILGRREDKTQQAVQEIRRKSGNNSTQYYLADFAHLNQVNDLACSIVENYSRLDVLVNNAGGFFNRRHETSYGVEKTLLVNHLAPFLLTNRLLNILQASAPARIVNVTSDAHRQDNMDFNDLGFRRGYFGMKAYARSKLANIMFTYELARRLEGSQVTVNAVHPGHVATDIWRTNFSIFGPTLKWFMGLFALTPEEGADTLIYLASSPDVDGLTGKYFVEREPVQSSQLSYNEATAKRLWELSETMIPQELVPGSALPREKS